MGEETPLSESNYFEKKEGGRNSNIECPPLNDQWYDTYIHFPVVPSDYSPPLSGHVWLSICRHDMEVSWAPLVSTITHLDIHQRTSLHMPVLFDFGSDTSLGWKEWVDRELFDVGFMVVLQ